MIFRWMRLFDMIDTFSDGLCDYIVFTITA